jgi:hypothetical protein
MMRNVIAGQAAGAASCPNCREPLNSFERLPAAPPTSDTLTASVSFEEDLFEFDDDSSVELELPVFIPGQITHAMVNSLYSPILVDYIWNQVRSKQIDHLAAYSKVYTSLLTVQAVCRGGLVRMRKSAR